MSAPPTPFDRSLQRLKASFWQRRFLVGLARTVWLALLPPTIAQAGYLWLHWQPHWTAWFLPTLGVSLASLLWAARPINEQKLIARLDAGLGLRTRLVTAYEVSRRGNAVENPVAERLMQEAVTHLIELRQRVRLVNRHLWLEMQVIIGVLAVLVALVLLDALSPRLPNATAVALPTPLPEPSAEEVISPEPQLQPPPFPPDMQAASAQQLQRALEALADALRDPAATRGAAEAIDRGDLSDAATELRRLADRLGDLSEAARQELSEALGEAADNIGGDAPALTGPLNQGRDALNRDDLVDAGQALEALAHALDGIQELPSEVAQMPPEAGPADETEESTAEQLPAPDDSTAESGGEGESGGGSQPDEAERLAVEGQPLELESEPETDEQALQPAELDAALGDRTTTDSPFSRGLPAVTDDLGPDPLAYPWDKREVVKRYFSP